MQLLLITDILFPPINAQWQLIKLAYHVVRAAINIPADIECRTRWILFWKIQTRRTFLTYMLSLTVAE